VIEGQREEREKDGRIEVEREEFNTEKGGER
jgi:hypothetical protein